ncbi:hypothetical protein VF14_00200 [Nostoc linckia z18]|uniref:Uncharacterized protein n=2 Tax=Nostoc linckia TaxID=92942 RepID=A0A9Q5ZGQ0_NOSLI|nr:hypothetical protein [Nostoc linckia]PHK43107.1 hypothetical protein VF12_00200 [Nostoc linckia z15]PHK48376.1 hypothetical protein VF13_00195 [Nostoc linckia z16]PHJ67285.1 hypothetical protein VF02_05860 [Nostoc linckia z1]PHJ71086.1 hypothetical protein VF05_08215 [Nostoc linckia z3]PHJ76525.1 hypothetical protein VF03_07070 [Nostoc linckia z2]
MTSKHTFEESSNPLAQLNYIPLLDKIIQLIQRKKIFKLSPDKNKLLISAYELAYEIAINTNQQPLNALNKEIGVKAATVNFISDTEFYSKIQTIRDELRKQLDDACGQNQTQACLENICSSLSDFNENQPSLPFNYPFNQPYSFTSQRLTIENSLAEERRNGGDSVIKAHHLNVRFEGISQFDNKLLESIRVYIDKIATPDTDDWQEVTELLTEISQRENSELTELRRIVDTESLPRLLRDIKIDYLDYLRVECAKTNIRNSHTEGFECLETLINRLRLLSDYINEPNLDNTHFEVSYLLETATSLRTAFSQADAFDKLPVVPEYEGVIGESIDKEKDIKEFNLGLRLKLNGSVNAYDEKSVLDYYMTELDPTSQRHQEQLQDPVKSKNFKTKVLIIACLYYFIFAVDEDGKVADKDYNPIPKFEIDVLNKLKPGATSNEEVKNVLCNIRNLILNQDGWRVRQKLASLRNLLRSFLEKREILPPLSKSVQLCINTAILNKTAAKILKSRNFFKIDLIQETQSQAKAKAREALGYIEVVQPTVNLQSLTSLAVTFTFDDVRYFTEGNKQNFSMKYDTTGIKTLPVIFSPIGEEKIKSTNETGEPVEKIKSITHPIYNDYFERQNIIVIYYKIKEVREIIFKNSQSPAARIYRQVFTLLSYLCISVCREAINLNIQQNEKLFIPIFRFHIKDENDTTEDEVFLNSLSKALAHILRRDCLADAQGINVKDYEEHKLQKKQNKNKLTGFDFRVRNALSSMYALVPKTFEFKGGYRPQLDRLAIIVVSSWLSDAIWDEKDKTARISNIYGEIIVINKVSDTAVKIETIKTFADNQPHSKIYTQPEIIKDEISKLYQQGYQHFLYIAKAPYSRSLGITKLESDPDSLFFMSQSVVQYLKQGKPDIKLYPIFMDTYPALNFTRGTVDSFYIPDTEELEKLSKDKSQQTRVFLNLFTGRSVDEQRTIFNSVVCYSTLLNIYDVADTRDIMAGLLDKNSPLQQAIVQYITLFHFSRYEVNRNIAFKLNPYSKLIGDEGIGTISTYTYSNRNVKFNNLAFLTSIRSALYGR